MSCNCNSQNEQHSILCPENIRSSAAMCDDRFQSLPRSRRVRLIGADGKCLTEFPGESRGFVVYDGAGGAIVTNKPVVPIPYRRDFAKDPSSGAPILDANGEPIELTPPAVHSLIVADSDGGQFRYRGQAGVAQRLRWDGFNFRFIDEVFEDKEVFCGSGETADGEEAMLVPETINKIVNGVCTPVTCYRIARRAPSLQSLVDQRDAELQAAIDALQEKIEAISLDGLQSQAATYVEVAGVFIPHTSLANRQNIVNSWTMYHNPFNIVSLNSNNKRIIFEAEAHYTVQLSAQIRPAGSLGPSEMTVRPIINGTPEDQLRIQGFVRGGSAAPTISINFSRLFNQGDQLWFDAGMNSSAGGIQMKKVTIVKL
jgi:hypothetical protein